MNKVTKDVRELALEHGPKAIARLAELIDSEDERIAVMAANSMLDRAYGKATTIEVSTDKDGGKVVVQIVA